MKVSRIRYGLLCFAVVAEVWGFDGIAVSDVNRCGVYGHRIEGSTVVQTFELVATTCDDGIESGITAAHSPAINTYGTHVAFIGQSHDGAFLGVTRADEPAGLCKRIVVDSSIDQVEWPRGDWVYWSSGGKLYRTDVQTCALEHVLTLHMPEYGIDEYPFRDQFTLSSDAHRIHFQVGEFSDELEFLEGRYQYELPGDGALRRQVHGPGGGCGPAVSPSGLKVSWQTDAGHTRRDWSPWGMNDSGGSFNYRDWNDWSVDGSFACTHNSLWTETVGLGIVEKGNRWSRNSDKWLVLQMGWWPEGRFAKNGSNLVIVNYVDSVSLNVTRYPRFASDRYPIPGDCPTTQSAERYQVHHGDFWLRAPLDDVHEPLRADVLERGSYQVVCLDTPDACTGPSVLHRAHRTAPGPRPRGTAEAFAVKRYMINGRCLKGQDAAPSRRRSTTVFIAADKRSVTRIVVHGSVR